MNFNPTHYATKQSLLEEIDKAFKNVSLICREYFEKRTVAVANPPKVEGNKYRNFNNYKGLTESNDAINANSESINLIDKDE